MIGFSECGLPLEWFAWKWSRETAGRGEDREGEERREMDERAGQERVDRGKDKTWVGRKADERGGEGSPR